MATKETKEVMNLSMAELVSTNKDTKKALPRVGEYHIQPLHHADIPFEKDDIEFSLTIDATPSGVFIVGEEDDTSEHPRYAALSLREQQQMLERKLVALEERIDQMMRTMALLAKIQKG